MLRKRKLAVQIVRFVDENQPGWVEAKLKDANGESHTFLDKVPIFSENDLDRASSYPQPGVVRCEAMSESKDDKGRTLVEINTARPDAVESTDGRSRFVVAAEQLSDGAWEDR